MDTTTPTAVTQYNAQERILCYHGSHVYDAKVLKTKNFDEPSPTTGEVGPHYLVHKGWKQTWDEWVPENRLLKLNKENLELQKKLLLTHPATSHDGSASKASNKSTAGSGSASTRGRKEGARWTKRAREDEENKRPEMKLTVPEVLETILVDDREAVMKINQLVTLPREPTVLQVNSHSI